MNKDVVYIEPEDDITDIIARVKNAKEKLVALVPPKKIGVLRSAVNTKLIAKAGKSADKVVVIVTTDSALMKLAAAAQIPVAKTLQSRPKLPSEIIEETEEPGEQVIDEKDFSDETEGDSADTTSKEKPAKSAPAKKPDQSFSSDNIEKKDKKDQDDKSGKKKGLIPTLEKYRKWVIIGAVAFVLLIGFLVWAFVFAPAVDIDVSIRTTANNFSEDVSFVTKKELENTAGGVFYLEEKKVEKTNSQEFTATGQKDVGAKAAGTLDITAEFNSSNSDSTITVAEGAVFTTGGLQFATGKSVTFRVDDECTMRQIRNDECRISTSVPATAVEPGDKYNIAAGSSWVSSIAHVSAGNSAAFSGGSSNIVTVVSQQDYDNAKNKLENAGREDGKTELLKEFGDDMTVIESSLDVSTSDPKSTPGVGEEVKSGVTPKIEATTTYKMYAVDKTKISDYVKSKAEKNLASDQRIYAVDTPFFENFKKTDDKFTAKLKSSTQTGPKVNEEDIMEKSKGKKIGEVKSILKSITGVSTVSIKGSFPWVGSVPNDPNKISIELKVEE